MGRQHVVVGRDDADVRRVAATEFCLVAGAAGRKAVREVRASQLLASRLLRRRQPDPVKITRATIMTALDDAVCDFADAGSTAASVSVGEAQTSRRNTVKSGLLCARSQ
jgi:hypothetical protein